jgi:hypothetical protein
MTPVPRPGPARFAAALALTLVAFGGLVRLAAACPSSWPGSVPGFVVGASVAVLFFSVWEWTFHRYLYHRVLAPVLRPIFLTHHRDHHFRHYPPWRFTGEVAEDGLSQAHASVWRQVLGRRSGGGPPIPDRWVYLISGGGVVAGSGWLLTGNPFFCAGVGGAGVVLFLLFGKVHGTIHRPGTHPHLEAQPWFAFLERHHYIHHVDTEANENFLVPLADWLFGTLRLSLTEEEKAEVQARQGGPDERHGTA